jgi:hypothetical protein
MSTIPWTHEGSSSLRCSGDESSGKRDVGGRSKAPLQHFFLCFSAHLLAARASDRQGERGEEDTVTAARGWLSSNHGWLSSFHGWLITHCGWSS